MTDGAVPTGVRALSDIFAANGYTLYLVGGYVRNLTLGLPGGDFDVCSCARPEEAAEFLRAAGLRVIEKAMELGTIEAHLDMDGLGHVFEHTTFRSDDYPTGGDHRPHSVVFTDDITKDARRRDFTVNALYLDITAGGVIDPTGRGVADCEARVIRAAANDPDETIRDDGLRIMRMARFAAELGFAVEKALQRCAAGYAHLLADISAERKCDELKKILMADTKYPSANRQEKAHKIGLQLLRDTGALKYILPRLWKGNGVQQSAVYHMHDVLGHGIAACAAAQPVLSVRMAALLHDIGKPEALKEGGNMYGHEHIGAALAREEMAALKFDKKTAAMAETLIKNHMFDLEGRAKPKTIRRRAIKLGKEAFGMLIDLRRADFLGSGKMCAPVVSADNWQAELQRMIDEGVPWTIAQLDVSGSDIMQALHIEASPDVGKLLSLLHDECVIHPKNNRRDILLRMAVKLAPRILL